MMEIEPPHVHHLNAVLGWMDLGNVKEAKAEWRQVGRKWRDHPDALEVAWQLYAVERKWRSALEVAERLRIKVPDRVVGWICQSYSLHELKRTREARDRLKPVVDRFPDEGTIPYNLACYACQLGELDEARGWLKRAIGIKNKFRKLALNDPDLQALRDSVRKL